MNKPILACDPGIGDMLVLSGAVIDLCYRKGGKEAGIQIPCLPENQETIRSIFANHLKVTTYPVENITDVWKIAKEADYNCYWARVEGVIELLYPELRYPSWDKWCYQRLGVDFENRWDKCPVAKACESVPQIENPYHYDNPYIVVHDDPNRGFNIDMDKVAEIAAQNNTSDLPIVEVWKHLNYPSVLSWANVLLHAQEVHFMDSWVLHFMQCIPHVRSKLYWHRYVRGYLAGWHDFTFRHPVNIVTATAKLT